MLYPIENHQDMHWNGFLHIYHICRGLICNGNAEHKINFLNISNIPLTKSHNSSFYGETHDTNVKTLKFRVALITKYAEDTLVIMSL